LLLKNHLKHFLSIILINKINQSY